VGVVAGLFLLPEDGSSINSNRIENLMNTKTQESTLTRSQVKTKGRVMGNKKIEVAIRFDDQCGNAHNSFSLTATIWEKTSRGRWRDVMGGCCHEEIVKFFPDLEKFVKWHLTSTDGPMHYVANTMFHARDCDTEGKRPGDAIGFETFVKFGSFPKRFEFGRCMTSFLKDTPSGEILASTVVEVPHEGNPDIYGSKYTLSQYPEGQWYEAPFNSEMEAGDFLSMVAEGIEFEEVAVRWAKAVEPNLEHARSSAVWPDATLEQLRDKEALENRGPALLNDFRAAMEELGFTW